jgi:hypothetical protein
VSNKYECPSCKSYTSRIYDVFDGEHEACPNCGLSGDVMREIRRVREGHASDEVKAQFEELAVRAGKADADAAKYKAKLDRIRGYFTNFSWEDAERDYFGD